MLGRQAIQRYLEGRYGPGVSLLDTHGLSGAEGPETALKAYGYGEPIQVDFATEGGRRSLVLTTLRPGPFGHEHLADRAQILLWNYDTYGRLAPHVRADDVAALSINYVFFGLLHCGWFSGPFAELFEAFYRTYIRRTQDAELMHAARSLADGRTLARSLEAPAARSSAFAMAASGPGPADHN